ncbi:MAG: Gfo/Idh/MocA family oxidoreductase [Candidatus Hadarchaeales archaeon]
MRIGIIGAGLVGSKRAKAIGDHQLLAVADINESRARELAAAHRCRWTKDWKDVVADDSIDLVIVSTTNDWLAPITIEAIKNGKHVLVEKPAARNPPELQKVIEVAKKHPELKVKVGFNHRFHPAIQKAKEIFESGRFGRLMYIRGRYGHGGRKGYEKEWRAKPEIAGGGEMLDQGIHLVDLCRWFGGDFDVAMGYCATMFWDMEVEDNCFALLKNKRGAVAWLHASWTEWKNLFSFEIFCERGKLEINGLGGSYGEETLTCYKMRPEFGVPDKEVFSWKGEDVSWRKELEHFVAAIEKKKPISGTLEDAAAAMKLIFDIYRWSKKQG